MHHSSSSSSSFYVRRHQDDILWMDVFSATGNADIFLTTILEVKVTECFHMLLKQQNWKYETVEHCQVPETIGRIQLGISWSIGNAEYQTILCGWKYPMLASCITKTLCTVLTTQFYVDVGYVTLHNTECMYTVLCFPKTHSYDTYDTWLDSSYTRFW